MISLYNYSANIRKLIYTINVIKLVNLCLRKITNGKDCFVSVEALERVIYLRIKSLTEKWNRSIVGIWSMVLNELMEIFVERVSKYLDI